MGTPAGDPRPRDIYKQVLVGTDGSQTAAEAVRKAAELAAAFGARLTVLTVYSDVAGVSDAEADMLPVDLQWQVTGVAMAEETATGATAVAKELGADAHPRTERGEPAEAILNVLDHGNFDLVVVGSKGLSSPARFILGSVPNAVSHHAPCDVAIIHTA